jgi:broad specificity phosphatase PhoE
MNIYWKSSTAAVFCVTTAFLVAEATYQGAFCLLLPTRNQKGVTSRSFLTTTTVMKATAAAKQSHGNNSNDKDDKKQPRATKQIVFVRHSTTYMNEYLGRSLSFGAPQFTDVFDKDAKDLLPLYRDTPLSPRGRQLVQNTLARNRPAFCTRDLQLVVVSPLKRALQTFDIGIRPHLLSSKSSSKLKSDNAIPVVVLPEAAERLYLISDVGTPVDELEQEYGYMDFGEIPEEKRRSWWWTPATSTNGHYVEWRPVGQGQRYACPGEPRADFDARMMRLYQWLDQRPELNIAVVCHHGVIDWMLDMDFDNCQWRAVGFDQIRPLAMPRISNMSSSSSSSSSY